MPEKQKEKKNFFRNSSYIYYEFNIAVINSLGNKRAIKF